MKSQERPSASTALEQFEELASARTRDLVSLLADQPEPLSPAALAVVRAVEEHDGDPADVSERTIRRHRIDLVHKQLPRLADREVIEYDGETATVTDEGETAVQTLTDAIPAGIAEDDLLSVLTHDRRRAVASVLATTPHETVTLTGLAVAVTSIEQDEELTRIDRSVLEEVQTTLHHVHLPKLADAGFIEYDGDTLTVTDRRTGDIAETWLTETAPITPVSSDGGQVVPAADDEEVWTIDEHESVVERMRALADHADDELFVVLGTDGLLTPGCLIHLRMASERGVDVAVGSPSETVRDRIEAAVPKARVWEPQRDWLVPSLSENDRLSRLVVADSRAAMLATLDQGRVEAETAVTGDGRDNGLVTTVRELLGSRLDAVGGTRSEYQSPAPP